MSQQNSMPEDWKRLQSTRRARHTRSSAKSKTSDAMLSATRSAIDGEDRAKVYSSSGSSLSPVPPDYDMQGPSMTDGTDERGSAAEDLAMLQEGEDTPNPKVNAKPQERLPESFSGDISGVDWRRNGSRDGKHISRRENTGSGRRRSGSRERSKITDLDDERNVRPGQSRSTQQPQIVSPAIIPEPKTPAQLPVSQVDFPHHQAPDNIPSSQQSRPGETSSISIPQPQRIALAATPAQQLPVIQLDLSRSQTPSSIPSGQHPDNRPQNLKPLNHHGRELSSNLRSSFQYTTPVVYSNSLLNPLQYPNNNTSPPYGSDKRTFGEIQRDELIESQRPKNKQPQTLAQIRPNMAFLLEDKPIDDETFASQHYQPMLSSIDGEASQQHTNPQQPGARHPPKRRPTHTASDFLTQRQDSAHYAERNGSPHPSFISKPSQLNEGQNTAVNEDVDVDGMPDSMFTPSNSDPIASLLRRINDQAHALRSETLKDTIVRLTPRDRADLDYNLWGQELMREMGGEGGGGGGLFGKGKGMSNEAFEIGNGEPFMGYAFRTEFDREVSPEKNERGEKRKRMKTGRGRRRGAKHSASMR